MGKIGCHQIIAKNDQEIPAISEKIIRGKVVDMPGNLTDLFIIEPADVKKENIGLVPRALVQSNESVLLRIMNITDEPQKITAGTNLAILSPVSEVKSHCTKTAKSSKCSRSFDSYMSVQCLE